MDKDSLFSKVLWENRIAACNRVKAEHFLTPGRRINSKWIKNINVRQDTIKPLE